MATSYKILAAATGTVTQTAVYTVPAATNAIVSTLSVCNNTSGAVTVAVQVQKGGSGQYFYLIPNASLAAGTRQGFTEGWALGAGDVIRVAGTGVDFVFFGTEIA